jgi:MGT family glycosyltransferase
VNGLGHVYKTILEAVGKLSDVQVVLSIGKHIDLAGLEPIPQNTIVVRTAPQIELLERARLCITHAGLNTTLESLAHGVPMVAIPIAYDQPGISARIAYHGVGEFVDLHGLSADSLLTLIRRVLTNRSYVERACYFKEVIAKTRGLDIAAAVIEQAFQKAAASREDCAAQPRTVSCETV